MRWRVTRHRPVAPRNPGWATTVSHVDLREKKERGMAWYINIRCQDTKDVLLLCFVRLHSHHESGRLSPIPDQNTKPETGSNATCRTNHVPRHVPPDSEGTTALLNRTPNHRATTRTRVWFSGGDFPGPEISFHTLAAFKLSQQTWKKRKRDNNV